MQAISLVNLISRFRWKIIFTFSLVFLESLLEILYPLIIGFAINDLLEQSYQGITYLGILGVSSIAIGSARRFYDTRIYADIYCQIAPEMIERENKKESSISKIAARSNLLTEFVEFLENSMPELIRAIISLIGVLVIIVTLNLNIFYACLGAFGLVVIIYILSGKLNYRLNANYNNELEQQVEVLEKRDSNIVTSYYRRLMKWNIHLSDLETVNFIFIWLGVIALYIYTPVTLIKGGALSYGLIFSVLMYVGDYIESIVTFPLHIQQFIRLKEISKRLMY